jgi:hypothetical protein
VREVMESALPLEVPLTVDLKVGDNWEQVDLLEQTDDGAWRRVGAAPQPELEETVALVEVDAGASRSRDGRP